MVFLLGPFTTYLVLNFPWVMEEPAESAHLHHSRIDPSEKVLAFIRHFIAPLQGKLDFPKSMSTMEWDNNASIKICRYNKNFVFISASELC